MALTWMGYYESCIASEQSCINEWNAMKDLETTRPDSPTMFVDKSVNINWTPYTKTETNLSYTISGAIVNSVRDFNET